MTTAIHVGPLPSGIILQSIAACPPKDRESLAAKLAKLEKKIFPSSEAFDYGSELKKKNVGIILAVKEGTQELVGYLVYQRQKSLAWLHKLATIEQERRKGIAKCLVDFLCQQMKKGGCRTISLWVDEVRNPARALYASCAFQQIERLPEYYGPGRTALKLELNIAEH
ncbi:acyl-CoA N-acyltransferase [Karstenula rhodostoma CBS 690.94]|uniref:Acyl-CoA N-acyltransferase n=1 Tax=Karstenula rhodostoma CBS 690.94 TaxID=1392251 RepID=A0A9P4PR11_9PLEO|nr:acyl-CoA N-acyltransferase [Karstenula rhodostoma CBS 690.94]